MYVYFQEGIREYWYALSQVESVWNAINPSETGRFHERFAATTNGIYTMFPATRIREDYNYMLSDWYNAAISQKDTLVLTPPRTNEYERCNVITIAHSLFQGT